MNFLSVCSGIECASAVLAHHYPTVPNLGDMTKFHEWQLPAFSLLVGGTPCQAFSVAGLRAGLADPRGNLTLTFLALAGKHRPRWICWENVPGVLSDRTNAFGHFLAGLAELGYGWAYRVLDAQHFGIPQRRRRVFVVGCLGDWQGAAEVLFERESLRGDSPPSRKAREGVAPTISARTQGGGGLGTDFEVGGGLIPDVADCLQERDWRGPDTKTKTGHLIPDVSPTLRAGGNKTGGDRPPGTDVDTCESLLPIAFSGNDSGDDAMTDLSPTVRAGNNDKSHANGGTPPAIAFKPSHYTRGKDGAPSEIFPPLSKEADRGDQEAVIAVEEAVQVQWASGGGKLENPTAQALRAGAEHSYQFARQGMQVRRLTPVECERLQGFPDNYTAIPRGKKSAAQCPDGPRYKVLGNSMARPVMAWIGQRIDRVNEERFSV